MDDNDLTGTAPQAAFPHYDGDELSLPEACIFFRNIFAALYAPQQKKLYVRLLCLAGEFPGGRH